MGRTDRLHWMPMTTTTVLTTSRESLKRRQHVSIFFCCGGQASGSSVLPFGIEKENKLLAAINALEFSSLYTSYWRVKTITEDAKKTSVRIVLVCMRQPDRHGRMGSAVTFCAYPHHWQCCFFAPLTLSQLWSTVLGSPLLFLTNGASALLPLLDQCPVAGFACS